MTKLCQVLHGEAWVPARRFWGRTPPESSLGEVMLESKGGWKVEVASGEKEVASKRSASGEWRVMSERRKSSKSKLIFPAVHSHSPLLSRHFFLGCFTNHSPLATRTLSSFLYVGTGIEKYVFNPHHIRREEEV